MLAILRKPMWINFFDVVWWSVLNSFETGSMKLKLKILNSLQAKLNAAGRGDPRGRVGGHGQ